MASSNMKPSGISITCSCGQEMNHGIDIRTVGDKFLVEKILEETHYQIGIFQCPKCRKKVYLALAK